MNIWFWNRSDSAVFWNRSDSAIFFVFHFTTYLDYNEKVFEDLFAFCWCRVVIIWICKISVMLKDRELKEGNEVNNTFLGCPRHMNSNLPSMKNCSDENRRGWMLVRLKRRKNCGKQRRMLWILTMNLVGIPKIRFCSIRFSADGDWIAEIDDREKAAEVKRKRKCLEKHKSWWKRKT